MKLEGKTAVVTGASRGIGRSIAIELAKNGANVVVNYSGSEEKAKETAKEVEAAGTKALVFKADVSNADDVQAMLKETVSTFGSIDILVNNAGITKDNLLMRMKEEDWDQVMDINLKSVFLTTKAAARPMMKQRKGKIINVSSIVGVMGNAGQANYVASKAGVIGLTKTSAKELAARGINVNAVAPGFIETDMTGELAEDVQASMKQMIPLDRFGKPEDIAKAVVFLASEDSDYITGQTIHIDGGMVM
ncbi:3-oxoacyl-[acyl-carrier-protein] reductase [Jeotgalibacillus haloalkalitolerans]|uniref:3-oxoacyl-[acyl-carrier-protein] reductase n=1 Tax=Jeotgalibacillus haloalkalitolerans TaxID=3104292 RepID=A0ABU5KK91_9BACL|nr:3-oxoacyl-[acyl-carrier-protein] reductase [Jeotgalibacillus sp. HH7-29]MDZ5711687.1 3-oxoacyl-[acyl-carrier-protein] reductase [Jeotgalibacillus sp. HH7-29]